MAFGLKTWNSSGVLQLDTSTIVARILGSAAVTAGSPGNVTNAGFATGTPFYIWQPVGSYGAGTTAPVFSWSGNTLSWTSSSVSGTVFYGVRG